MINVALSPDLPLHSPDNNYVGGKKTSPPMLSLSRIVLGDNRGEEEGGLGMRLHAHDGGQKGYAYLCTGNEEELVRSVLQPRKLYFLLYSCKPTV